MSKQTDFVLWGSHPLYADGVCIKLTGGTLRECRSEQRYREQDGRWLLGTYRKGDAPEGLRLMAEKRSAS